MDLYELCATAAKEIGYELDVPITINNRFRRVLGRYNGEKIEISKFLIDNGSEEALREVVLHELAHYLCHKKYGERCGHDERFKKMCRKLNIPENARSQISIDEKAYKYTLYCSKCGKTIGHRSRACEITRYPNYYTSKCCGADLAVKVNF